MTRDEMDRAAAWLRDTADEYAAEPEPPVVEPDGASLAEALRIAAAELDGALGSDECAGPAPEDPRQIRIPGCEMPVIDRTGDLARLYPETAP